MIKGADSALPTDFEFYWNTTSGNRVGIKVKQNDTGYRVTKVKARFSSGLNWSLR